MKVTVRTVSPPARVPGGRRRDEAEAAAHTSRTTADVIGSRLSPYSRVGTRNPVKLAIRLAGGRQERTVYVPPTFAYEPGRQIQVAYAPDDPRNFLPLE